MDILPTFPWSMTMLPAFMWLETRIGAMALLPSVALYGAAWVGGLMPPGLGVGIRLNPFAWRILFILGAWFGRRMLLLGRAAPDSRGLTGLAVFILVVGFLLRLDWFGALPFQTGIPENDWVIGKNALALALALVVARVTPRDAAWMRRAPARWLAAAGRHGLQVFCLGLFLSWMVTAAFRSWPREAIWLDAPLMLAGCAILLSFGMWRDRGRDPGRAGQAVGSGGVVEG